jgi:sigma-E factor negative regulatory protein RseB
MKPTGTRWGAGAAVLRRVRLLRPVATLALATLALAPPAFAEDAAACLARAAAAARDLTYGGTIVYQRGPRIEVSRLMHLNDHGSEFEKLVNVDGPAREVIRSDGEVRYYYPDSRLIRIEPRAFRNAFPSLSAQEQKALIDNYDARKAEVVRVAGQDAQAWEFEPKDGLRFAHKFWVDTATGLLLKARIVNDRGEIIEQFAFNDVATGARIDREAVRPTWNATPPDWHVLQPTLGDIDSRDTGWVAGRLPPGFSKIVEGYRLLRDRRDPVVHLVYSDGLVAVSVFIEKADATRPRPVGHSHQGTINVFARPVDDRVVTALGEVPSATVRQIANSIAHR